MKMYTSWITELYRHIFEETPICHWGYMYYDLTGRYIQLASEQYLLDDLFHKELYAEQIMSDIEIIDSTFYSSDVTHDCLLADTMKQVLTNRGYSYFVDFIKRNTFSNNFSTEIVTIASFSNPIEANNFVLNNIDILNKISENMAARCRRLITKENTLILPKDFMISANEFFEHKKQTSKLSLKKRILKSANKSSKLPQFINDNAFDFNQLPFSFLASKEITYREKEIIYLYYYGFNLGRIAAILDISKRTVEKDFENIRKKLKCESSGQIIPTLLRFDNSLQLSIRKSDV
ncbi:helix-turn-helix transcriptional regulator [Legionella lansingensis]|nr:LuxR C-terminal-related transcriptional regulator [Legionella lansingensis]